MIHLRIKPYRKEISVMNFLESMSFITLIFCYFLGSIWLDYQNDINNRQALMSYKTKETSPKGLSIALFVISILLNTIFILLCLRFWLKYEWENLKSDFKVFITSVKSCIGRLSCSKRKTLKEKNSFFENPVSTKLGKSSMVRYYINKGI